MLHRTGEIGYATLTLYLSKSVPRRCGMCFMEGIYLHFSRSKCDNMSKYNDFMLALARMERLKRL